MLNWSFFGVTFNLIEYQINSNSYDGLGNRTSLTQANGMMTTYAYDNLNRWVHQGTRKSAGARITSYKNTLASTGLQTRVVELNDRQVDDAFDEISAPSKNQPPTRFAATRPSFTPWAR